MRTTGWLFIQGLVAFATQADAQTVPPLSSRRLWYNKPAPEWNLALPVGSGRLGGMVYGGISLERVQMNEDSIWSGGFQNRVNSKAGANFQNIRNMLVQEKLTDAGKAVLATMTGTPTSPRAYHPMVELFARFNHPDNQVQNFSRWLDTYEGYVGSEYTYQGVKYTRTAFGSFPASVMAFRFDASSPASITTTISLFRERYVNLHKAELGNPQSLINIRAGSGQSDGIQFTAQARIVVSGSKATTSTNGTAVTITNADSVTVYVDAETSYRYSNQGAWEAELKKKLDNAASASYDTIKQNALNDYTALAHRVTLDLGSSGDIGKQNTLDRLNRYRKTSVEGDPELATMLFYLGRYMLITASRKEPGNVVSLPANLQGVWSPSYDPPWGGKYTVNINTEMNYWPAEITNLAETHLPLFDLIDVIRPRGRAVAKSMYNCPGFMLHHNTDLWGDSAPVDNGVEWTMWPMGSVWLTNHLIEHYRFNGDKSWLSSKALPVLKEAAEFYYCYLFDYKGYYSTGPSISPENRFRVASDQQQAGASEAIDIAPTMDNELLFELFSAIVEAGKELGTSESDADIKKAATYLAKIKKPEISKSGTLLEWRRDYQEVEPGHRHVSHLFGLHPGRSISMISTPNLAAAAKATLDKRLSSGGAGTGWSRAWTINWFARLWNGDQAWKNIQQHLKISTNDNMFDNNPAPIFQADGNYGFSAGVTEMLLQSHDGFVHLLPALPNPGTAIPKGSITGIVARGGFVLDIAWESGKLKQATVLSKLGNTLPLRVANNVSFKVNGTAYSSPLKTAKGDMFTITL